MTQNKKFCILIPTINRKDLLERALKVYAELYPDIRIVVLDNGHQLINRFLHPKLNLYNELVNLGVAGSWNRLIRIAVNYGYENMVILNDDIVLQTSVEELSDIINCGTDTTFHVCRPFYNWSVFIIRKKIVEKVGFFDTKFEKCFFEDNDYLYRMKLAGIDISYEDLLNPDNEYYVNSGSTQVNPLLGDYISNRNYYIEKWGGEPGQEQYQTPFNK